MISKQQLAQTQADLGSLFDDPEDNGDFTIEWDLVGRWTPPAKLDPPAPPTEEVRRVDPFLLSEVMGFRYTY